MAKKKSGFATGRGGPSVLRGRDWMTIIGSLLHDKDPTARQLARTLLTKTKHGRQVQVLRLIHKRRPTIPQMQRTARMSRRTIFRYLNSLEEYGARFVMDNNTFRYELVQFPHGLKRIL